MGGQDGLLERKNARLMRNGIFDKTFLRFLLVGAFNTLVGCGIMFSLYNLAGCSYWLSSAANYAIGSIISFFLNKNFTFQNHERSWKPAVRFIINVAVCYLIAYGAAKPMVLALFSGQNAKLQENIAMASGMCLYTLLNFFGQRFFAFRDK